MRLASSHGASRRVTRLSWLQQGHRAHFATAGLNPVTRKSFEKLQHELDYEPYVPRGEVNPHAKSIAVLGGGITGLTTAFELSRTVPGAKITIYETAKRLGGWMDSEIVPVDGGEVVFEWGPRTLRHTGDGSDVATINLVRFLHRTRLSMLIGTLCLDGPSGNGSRHCSDFYQISGSSQPLYLLP
jgi:hypothetical protein